MAGLSTDPRADRGADSEWPDEAPTGSSGFRSPELRVAVHELNARRFQAKKKADAILLLLQKRNSEPPEVEDEKERPSQVPKLLPLPVIKP